MLILSTDKSPGCLLATGSICQVLQTGYKSTAKQTEGCIILGRYRR